MRAKKAIADQAIHLYHDGLTMSVNFYEANDYENIKVTLDKNKVLKCFVAIMQSTVTSYALDHTHRGSIINIFKLALGKHIDKVESIYIFGKIPFGKIYLDTILKYSKEDLNKDYSAEEFLTAEKILAKYIGG